MASKELAEYQQALRQTQNALADARKELKETRKVNEKLHNLVQGFEIARAEDL